MKEAKTCIIVGAGHRAHLYASYALTNPEKFKIVGVAEPNKFRREESMRLYGFSEDMCFESAETLAACGEKLADCIINGTMDEDHVRTSVPLLELGYDMLLEKPFAINEAEMFYLLDVARKNNVTVMVCHVLRYAPFYKDIKEKLLAGEIGEIITITMSELVSYHHYSVSFLRGKWGNRDICGAPFLLAKTCHDLDLMLWLKGETPAEVVSMGTDFQFAEFKRPKGAADRCFDCQYIDDCLYSAKGLHMAHPDRWSFYVWDALENIDNLSLEQKEESLRTKNEQGRCAWRCNHKNTDHQYTMLSFTDGSHGVLNLTGGTAKPDRDIHIIGTKGEIIGSFESGVFTVRKIVPEHAQGYEEYEHRSFEEMDTSGALGGHGGGDILLVKDFVNVLYGDKPSISATTLEDSVLGHLLVFKAEEARKSRKVLNLLPILRHHHILKNSDMDDEVYRRMLDAD